VSKECHAIVQLESQSKSQFTTQSTSDYHFVSKKSGEQTIEGQNISLSNIPHNSPEKKHTQRQITAVNTYKYNKQFKQTVKSIHTYANKSNNTRLVYNTPHTD